MVLAWIAHGIVAGVVRGGRSGRDRIPTLIRHARIGNWTLVTGATSAGGLLSGRILWRAVTGVAVSMDLSIWRSPALLSALPTRAADHRRSGTRPCVRCAARNARSKLHNRVGRHRTPVLARLQHGDGGNRHGGRTVANLPRRIDVEAVHGDVHHAPQARTASLLAITFEVPPGDPE